MNPTSIYWTKPVLYSGIKGQKRLDGTYNFQFDLPWPDVTTSGWYGGEEPVPQRRELVYSLQPEYTALQNIVGSTGNVPKYNVYDPIYHYKRSDHTVVKNVIKV